MSQSLKDIRASHVSKATNIRDYRYLPENIKDDVTFGIPRTRRNPISPLDLLASSKNMTIAQAAANREKLSRRQLKGRTNNEFLFAGARANLYRSIGRGSVF